MRRFIVVIAALLLAACQQERLSYDGHVVRAKGWAGGEPAAGWQSVLSVYASDAPGAPPMLGDYKASWGTLTFTPAYPPSSQITLRIKYKPTGSAVETLIVPAKTGAASAASTSVAAVYPTTGDWPANQLKFYIQFSGPMTKGQAWRHIRLLDDKGAVIDKPFVEIDQELWDPNVDRLTVLFDPGRIKRGLTDNMTEGPPLVPGRHYRLMIDKEWLDGQGRPLTTPYERVITVIPDVRLPVDPTVWKITPPSSPSGALTIDFPRPMDYALARRTITVPGTQGTVQLAADETRWLFKPAHPWPPGRHEIRVDGIIEDLAGNRLGRLFDVDTDDPAQTKVPPKSQSLFFTAPG